MLYFKNIDTFLNESAMSRKIDNIQKKIDNIDKQLSKNPDNKNLTNQKEKLEKQLLAVKNIVDKKTVSDIEKEDTDKQEVIVDKTENTESETDTKSETETETKEIKITDQQLQQQLIIWMEKYSQAFKFKNDMPKSVDKETVMQKLLNTIMDDQKVNVKEGIISIVDILSKPEFQNQEIVISGYTSTPATPEYNKTLSERRAKIVGNVIRSVMKEKNINNNIKFKEIGYGESEEHLIVKNDTEKNNTPILNKNVKISDEIIKSLENSAENRQALNRRVKISLPKYINLEPKIAVENTDIEVEEEIEIEKPTAPKGNLITFNYDSYIMTEEGENVLKDYINKINKWNEKGEKILELYISAHTMKGEPANEDDAKLQENKLIYLSCNRGIIVKEYIKKYCKENINVHIYPVAYYLGEKKEINISTEYTQVMEKADSKAFTLCQNKKLLYENRDGLQYTKPLKNEAMRKGCLFNVKHWRNNNKADTTIPIEYWYEKGELDKFGLGYEKDLDKFKSDIEKLLKKSKFKPIDFVYKVK